MSVEAQIVWLTIFAAIICWFVGRMLSAMIAREVVGWLPVLSRWIVRRATRRLGDDGDRWEEEALRHLEQYYDRPLTGLIHAVDTFISIGRLEKEVAEEKQETVLTAKLTELEQLAARQAAVRAEAKARVARLRELARAESETIGRNARTAILKLEIDTNREIVLTHRAAERECERLKHESERRTTSDDAAGEEVR